MKQNKIKEIVFDTCRNYELQYSFSGENELKRILIDQNLEDLEIIKYYREYINYCLKNNLI